VTLDDLLADCPDAREVSPAEVSAASSGRVLVVLDDDPTGTQSVYDLPVLLTWTPQHLQWALRQAPAVYVMTNSRSLPPDQAARRNREIARASFAAAEQVGVRIGFVSRSDSTLRGHFPLETDVLAEEVTGHGGTVHGVVIVPAFPEAGRITVDGVHYAGGPTTGYTPVADTEFARDATFGYRTSELRGWVAQRSGGRYRAEQVELIDLRQLRTDPAATLAHLLALEGAHPVVCDAAQENDLRLLALALHGAERAGRSLLYRVGPPFVRAMTGCPARAPIGPEQLAAIRRGADPREGSPGGLIVVGSHVEVSTRQLRVLTDTRHPVLLEVDVATVLGQSQPTGSRYLRGLADRALAGLAEGDVVVSTTRSPVTGADPQASLAIARRVSAALVEVVRGVMSATRPRFVLAKGGITSSDVAAVGLGIERAVVRGTLLPGIISVWEPIDGPAVGVPYVVFPGNVGDAGALAEVVEVLSTRQEDSP
jgi:uncharacterized protein YgbK (DUF1537 family)